jgi:predicted RNA-binding protein with PIN domain
MRVLIVDGANVVGSRPDGWWRDREGAARRLFEQLTVADLQYDEVILILEGAARRGVPAVRKDRVRTVHAVRDGDQAVVETTRKQSEDGFDVTVVTADRALKARIKAAGGTSVAPSWLLNQL